MDKLRERHLLHVLQPEPPSQLTDKSIITVNDQHTDKKEQKKGEGKGGRKQGGNLNETAPSITRPAFLRLVYMPGGLVSVSGEATPRQAAG